MKRLLIYLIVLATTKPVIAQITLQYQACSNCQTNPTYLAITPYSTWDLNSDFGPRADGSFWHQGIDYNIATKETNIDETGYHIIAPFDGVFTYASLNTQYKYFIIRNRNNNNQNLGFGHIFDSQTNVTQISGDMVLTKATNDKTWVIINLTSGKAYSTQPGLKVKYGNNTYNTQDTCVANEAIAPIGNSCNFPVGVHLHLYFAKDPTKPTGSRNERNNCLNPLQIVNHQDTNYIDISVETLNNLTKYGVLNYYSGSELSSINVKIEMPGAGDSSRYDKETIDIDSVILQIKRFGEENTKYTLIKGDKYHSKIVLGGRVNHKRYPSSNWPPSNSLFDIANQIGSISNTGIKPYTYRESGAKPHDYFYFSDFYTRLHKSDQFSGTLTLANSNAEARYPDGVFLIRPKAYRIDNSEAENPANPENNAPVQLIFDNFKPFVSAVRVKEQGAIYYNYEREWHWITNKYLLSPLPPSKVLSNTKDVEIEITTSEPMKWVRINVGNHPERVQYCLENLDKTQWNFTLSRYFLEDGLQQVSITGEDLAGNQILSDPSTVYIRQSNTAWSPTCPSNWPPDTWHSFMFGNADVDFDAAQTGMHYNHIEFTDKSKITGNYKWEFGNPENSIATTKDAEFTYTNLGTYSVKHWVNQKSVSKHVTVNQITTPVCSFEYAPSFGGQKSNSTSVLVDFYSTSTGVIGSYSWDFGNGHTSTEKSPQNIEMSLYTWHTVTLSITNAAGTDVLSQDIYLDPNEFPYASIFPWELDYFVYDFEVLASNFNLEEPIYFCIDFGDGTSEEKIEYNDSYVFNHQYFEFGEFLIVATVTGIDNNGKEKTVSTAKQVTVEPEYFTVQIEHIAQNNPVYPLQAITFNALVEPSSNYFGNWAIYKKGDPTFYYSENFVNSNSTMVYSFPEKGIYKIVVDVYASGFAANGHAETEIEIVNAPDYQNVEVFGRDIVCKNSHCTYEALLQPIGEPGVPDSKWWPTNIRWTLQRPDGSTQIICDEFEYWESQFYQHQTLSFELEGTYLLRVETWNNQHDYEVNNLLGPQYINTISFYDLIEKPITVTQNLSAIELLCPTTAFPENVSASGDEDITLKFTNPGSIPIRWEVVQSQGLICNDCITIPQPASGQNLNQGNIITMDIDVQPNTLENSRYSVITISGFDAANNHVQGSPAFIQIGQNGTDGAARQIVEGTSPDHMFGYSVSIDGLVAVIGAPVEASSNTGYAFIYQKNEYGEWVKTCTLMPSEDDKYFGKSVDIYSDYAIVTGDGSDYIYIYKKPVTGWAGLLTELKRIELPSNDGNNVTIWDDYAAVGLPENNGKGTVNLYFRNKGGIDNWGLIKSFEGNNDDDYFGHSVDLYNNILAVGAPQEGWETGYINVYDRNLNSSSSWSLIQILEPTLTSDDENMRFGQKVSVFDKSIATSYYRTYWSLQGHVGYLQFPIFAKTEGLTYNLIGEAQWWIHNNDPLENYISSIAAFKSIWNSPPPEYNYSSIIGAEKLTNDMGAVGFCNFNNTNIQQQWLLEFQWYADNITHYEGEKWGNSVSMSYNTQITGIPGYSRTLGKRGAVNFQRISNFKSNKEAEIDLELTNFSKPGGVYSTVNARNLTLGGNNLPAVIAQNASIQYEGEEIQMANGFLAETGASLTIKSLPNQLNVLDAKPSQTNYPIEYQTIEKKQKLQKLLPQFPWQLYNPINGISLLDSSDYEINWLNTMIPFPNYTKFIKLEKEGETKIILINLKQQ